MLLCGCRSELTNAGAEGGEEVALATELEAIGGAGGGGRDGDGFEHGDAGLVVDVEAVSDGVDSAHECSLVPFSWRAERNPPPAPDNIVGSWAIDGISMGA